DASMHDAPPSRKSLAPSVHYPTIYKPTAREDLPLKEGFYQPYPLQVQHAQVPISHAQSKPVRPERAQATTSRPTHAERAYTVQAQRVEDPRVAQEIEAIRQRIQYLTTGRHRSSGLLNRQNQGTLQDMAQTQSLQHIDRLLSIPPKLLLLEAMLKMKTPPPPTKAPVPKSLTSKKVSARLA
ncbi:hypothetical protein E4U13_003923, partial [Claviceps humidiphila]